jgi:hypothetical protein
MANIGNPSTRNAAREVAIIAVLSNGWCGKEPAKTWFLERFLCCWTTQRRTWAANLLSVIYVDSESMQVGRTVMFLGGESLQVGGAVKYLGGESMLVGRTVMHHTWEASLCRWAGQ